MTTLSIVSPAHNEAENLPLMHERLKTVLGEAKIDWQWVVVDDSSKDDTFAVLSRLAKADPRVVGVRLARNFGSHLAIICGLDFAVGNCVAVLASDLEDPPEVLPDMLDEWRKGAKVVWVARGERRDKGAVYRGFAWLYYWFTRRILRIHGIPEFGADFLLMDAQAKDMVCQYKDKNISLFALMAWLDLDSAVLQFPKEKRRHGTSSWGFRRHVKLVFDTLVSFSHLPIRVMTATGAGTALIGLLWSIEVVRNALYGEPTDGWTSLMIVVLTMGGLQLVMLGFLGEYMWRTLEEARTRPRFLISEIIGAPPQVEKLSREPREQNTSATAS